MKLLHIFAIFLNLSVNKSLFRRFLKPLEQYGCVFFIPEEKNLWIVLLVSHWMIAAVAWPWEKRDTAGVLQGLVLLVLADLRELGDLHFTFQSPNAKAKLYFATQLE